MLKRTLGTTLAFSFLTFIAACSGADPGPVADAQAAPSSAESEAAVHAGRGFHDPARFIKRFDKDGNGVLAVTELPERMQKWLADADANHDGNLSAEELKAHKTQRFQAHFKEMDKNADGALSAAEVGEKRWEHLRAADADNNGSVTLAELEQAFASGKLHPPHGHGHGRGGNGKGHLDPAEFVQRFDQNKNGTLEVAELPERMQKWLSNADTNHDNSLSVEELKAFRESHHQPRTQ